MRRYVLAVSGGVDSVVLLHMAAAREVLADSDELIVAHFDHGIRQDSADDAAFVGRLAQAYGLTFETRREELGPRASEDKARTRRYGFLRDVAKKYGAIIVTAHHADDLVETIAINLIRGTGWRGLAVLDSVNINRPLLDKTKTELIEYAHNSKLEWREDATNRDTAYLRNDLRQKMGVLNAESRELLRHYRDRQCFLRREVDNEANRLIGASPYSRHLFIGTPETAGVELLRTVFITQTGAAPTRPQLQRALHAIKVLHGGKRYEVAAGVDLKFTKTHFVVLHEDKVV